MSAAGDAHATGALLEVAVALPVPGTFTYRDPRPGVAAAVGTQVVVPFGSRTVTGFVVGPGRQAGGFEAKEIEEVVGGEPAFDEAMIAFCRWTADYYQAPLGEVLRAALPQGEQATAKRAVRLTDLGRRALERQGTLIADAPRDPVLGALADAGGELALARLFKLVPRAKGVLARLCDEGALEMGDEVQRRRPAPTVALAFALPGAADGAIPKRAAARRALLGRLAAAADGLPLAALTAGERTHLRALSMAGLARIEHRPIRHAPAPPPAAAPPVTLNPAQASAVEALAGALPRGFATFLLHGVTGSGKTEVYLRAIAAARARGARGAGAGAGDRADAAAGGALSRALRRRRRGAAQRAAAARAPAAPGGACAPARSAIALGARSAVFAPVRALGVVVVDEEHDRRSSRRRACATTGATWRWCARSAPARWRCSARRRRRWRASYNAARGRFSRLSLPERATPRPLPAVEIVDLRRHPPGPDGLLSAPLADALGATLAARRAERSCSSTAAASRRSCCAAPAARWCAARTARSR